MNTERLARLKSEIDAGVYADCDPQKIGAVAAELDSLLAPGAHLCCVDTAPGAPIELTDDAVVVGKAHRITLRDGHCYVEPLDLRPPEETLVRGGQGRGMDATALSAAVCAMSVFGLALLGLVLFLVWVLR